VDYREVEMLNHLNKIKTYFNSSKEIYKPKKSVFQSLAVVVNGVLEKESSISIHSF
jgi:hypothetical protein